MFAVFKVLFWTGQHAEVTGNVELRRIDRSPICVWIVLFRPFDGVERSLTISRSTPVHRQSCVPASNQKFDFTERTALTTAVNMHYSGELLIGSLRKPIDRRHSSRLALEDSDQKSDMAKDTVVFLPFTNNLCLKRILARIKVGPQLLNTRWLLSNRGLAHDQRQTCKQKRSTHGNSLAASFFRWPKVKSQG